MLLDLFITHWTESWEIGKKAFDMLGLQRGVDWNKVRVTLVHDGTAAFKDEYFRGLPFQVFQAELPHGGIAAARNWCIDHSDAEWIKWCDFDDMFASPYGLRDLTHAMEIGQACDLLWFPVLAELMDGRVFLKDDRDPVVIHGKAFRRSFLIDHGIRYQEDLTWCEDSAFLALVELEIDKGRIGKVKSLAPIYTWIARQGSLCNRPEIAFQNRQSFFRRHCYVQDELLKHGKQKEAMLMTVRVLADSYYTIERSGIITDMSGFALQVWHYYDRHRADLPMITKKDFDWVLECVNKENTGCDVDQAKLMGWLKKLDQTHRRDADVYR